jgi:hypothetical protein
VPFLQSPFDLGGVVDHSGDGANGVINRCC